MTEANFEGGHPGPEWLSAWHDGELHDEAATAVRQHLDGCAACRHLLDEIRQLDQAARLADDAAPDPAAWEAIEGRLRQRLEDELGLGIPVGAAARYVETDADLVLRPSLAEVKGGKGARPFRLRWAVATAAGLGLGLFTLRTLSDNGWTVSRVMDPAGRRQEAPAVAVQPQERSPEEATAGRIADKSRTRDAGAPPAPAATPAPTFAKDASTGAEMSANRAASPPADDPERGAGGVREEAANQAMPADATSSTMAAADRYLADVEQTLRGKDSPALEGTAAKEDLARKKAAASPPAAMSSEASSAYRADADESMKTKAEFSVEPEYAAVFAAASRARESGEYGLARRGFELVAEAVPDQPLARDAEFEARLAGAHADIDRGQSPDAVRAALEREATGAWDAALAGSRPDCRRALACWRTIGALDDEQGRSTAQRDIDERVARLKACAG